MSSVTVLKLIEVDARKIVNDSHSRRVTAQDVSLMENSFLEHGYIPTANPVSVRYATAPEICSFYQGPPHNYSLENAKKLTTSIMSNADVEGHVYAYDGLIRKAAVLRMQNSKRLPASFTLRGILVPQFTPRQAIAYGLAQNSVNGIAVKLSPVEVLLKCREYDEIYNKDRPTRANQTDVARCMVEESVPSGTLEITKKKQAETRRQIIGVARKLPGEAFAFFESSLTKDASIARNAFTIANLKAIPKGMEQNIVGLLSRLETGYHLHMPKPKALDCAQVKQQANLVMEAIRHIEFFKHCCSYDSVPHELTDVCTRMTSTQKYDEELNECESSNELFKPLVELCRKSVPGGDLLIKQVSEKEQVISTSKQLVTPKEVEMSNLTEWKSASTSSQLDGANERSMPNESADGDSERESFDDECEITGPEEGNSHCPPGDSEECEVEKENDESAAALPPEWHVEREHYLEFEKGKAWDEKVSHLCDFAVMRLPVHEKSAAPIKRAITHLGHALHATGVAHVYCSMSQYGLIEDAVQKAGMYMARDGIVYIYDPNKVKRLTLSGQTQPIHQCAAVFWREPPSSRNKHYFSGDFSCPGSLEPGWVSAVTGLVPPEQMPEKTHTELTCTIMRRWCKPGGVCYDATAGNFDLAIAAHELGITYIGIESAEPKFEAGTENLLRILRDERKQGIDQRDNRVPKRQKKSTRKGHKRKSPSSDDTLSTTSETPTKKNHLGALCPTVRSTWC